MRQPGLPPERSVLEDAASCLDRFERLRDEVIRHAHVLGLPEPGPGLTGLGPLIETIAARRETDTPHFTDIRAASATSRSQ